MDGDLAQARVPGKTGIRDARVVETRGKWAYRRSGAGLPSVGIEDINHFGITIGRWVLGVERQVLLLLLLTEAGEGCGDGCICPGLSDVEQRMFVQDPSTCRYQGRREAAEAFARRWEDDVETCHCESCSSLRLSLVYILAILMTKLAVQTR